MDVLRNVKNVVVAGGAAGAPLLPKEVVGDVDFFVHGLDPNNEEELWAKAREVAEVLDMPSAGTIAIAPGVITFRFLRKHGEEDKRTHRVCQLILRAYPSVSSLIHAFDIPASSIAFDGTNTMTTALGAYAQMYRVNLVNLAYRSTTFEKRLVKYFRRGFALGLPEFDVKTITSNASLDLPYLRINPFYAHGNFVLTQVIRSKKVEGGNPLSKISDYSPSDHSFVESLFNFSQMIRGSDTLIAKDSHPELAPNFKVLGQVIPVSAFEVMRGRVLTKGDLLPRDLFDVCLQAVCDEASEKDIKPAFLRKYLGLTLEAAEYFVERRGCHQLIVEEHFQAEKALSMKPTVMKLAKLLTDRYEVFAGQAVEWWIKSEPGRQWTASRNPLIAEHRHWYSDKYFAQPSPEEREAAARVASCWFGRPPSTGAAEDTEDIHDIHAGRRRRSRGAARSPSPFSHPLEEEVFPEDSSEEAGLIAETRTVGSRVTVDVDWSKFKGQVLEPLPEHTQTLSTASSTTTPPSSPSSPPSSPSSPSSSPSSPSSSVIGSSTTPSSSSS